MIDMAMGIEQQHRFELVIADEIYHRVLLGSLIHARIDDGAFQAVVIQNNGVFLVRVIREYFYHMQIYKIAMERF